MEELIRYEPLGDSAHPLDMIVENDDGTYSIRSLEEMTPSTMTLLHHMNGNVFDLEILYYLMPCVDSYFPLDELDPNTLHIVSVRWNGLIKGRDGGFFPSSIFLTIRLGRRNISARIHYNKIHMAGPKSRDEADYISNFILDNIVEARRAHLLLVSNICLTLQVSRWLEDHSRGHMEIIDEEAGIIDTFCGPVMLMKPTTVYRVLWPTNIPDWSYEIVHVIGRCYTDISHTKNITIRTTNILQIERVCSDNLALGVLRTSMVNYNFELCFKVNRNELAIQLKNIGYSVTYHNVKSHDISIVMRDTTRYDDDELIFRKSGKLHKLYETKISVTAKGKVKLSGGGGRRLEKAYFNFMSDIIRISMRRPEIAVDDDDEL